MVPMAVGPVRQGDWSWACEDELEALGMALVLERAGVPVQVESPANGPATGGSIQLRVFDGASGERATALTSAILQHHARRGAALNVARFERRERLGRRALLICAAVGCLMCLVGLLSSF